MRARVVDFDAREQMAIGAATGGRGDGATEGSEGDAGKEWPESILLIGDKVVTDPPPAERYPHQLDLGQAWKELTGLPFVYAVWMCREADIDSSGVQAAAAILDRQRRHNATRLDWIISARAEERAWPADLARRYVGDLLRYDIGSREREAVERFLAEAAELGLAPRTDARWADVTAVAV